MSQPSSPEGHPWLGQLLLNEGLLSAERLDEALALQRRWGSRLGDIVLAKGWVRAWDFYRLLARHHGYDFVNLMTDPPDPELFEPKAMDTYSQLLVLPWHVREGLTWLAVADFGPELQAWAAARYPEGYRIVGTSKFDIQWQLQILGGAHYTDRALNALSDRSPDDSARQVATFPQLVFLYTLVSLFLLGLWMAPSPTLMGLNAAVSLGLLLTFGLKMILAWHGSSTQIDVRVTEDEVAALVDSELPTYTILVPMYREPMVLPILAGALRRLDYPLSKLDIKLVLEDGDTETIEAAKALGLEANFEIVRVPPSHPKTKPKACNYALGFARGELVTIYDAEDKPDPDQLKKVVVAFRKGDPKLVCLQARLSYFNANENWVTRMFTLEYTLWFDYYLPALEKLRIPIPLGGTSNHFKLDVLRRLEAWDPFNVTEDADLGVRITQEGGHVGVINSTTYEEANVSIPNWIRQRSRWIKGYMQTYLVHMRRPMRLYRTLGSAGFWGFQFFIGGTFLTALSAPLLWVMYVLWLFTRTRMFDIYFPSAVLYISLLNLLIGNGFFLYLTMVGALKRRLYNLVPFALTIPFYWLLQSVAGYKALWQLITNPFYWEKTNHGLSVQTAHEVEQSLAP